MNNCYWSHSPCILYDHQTHVIRKSVFMRYSVLSYSVNVISRTILFVFSKGLYSSTSSYVWLVFIIESEYIEMVAFVVNYASKTSEQSSDIDAQCTNLS